MTESEHPTLNVFLDLPSSLDKEIGWAWDLFAEHIGLPYRFTEEAWQLRIAMEPEGDLPISKHFADRWEKGCKDHKVLMPQDPTIRCSNGEPDILSTAFYMVNSIQEWNADSEELDDHGRFLSSATYQHRFKAFEKDLVSELFEKLHRDLAQKVPVPAWPDQRTRVFLTHDIDRIVNGNLREAAFHAKRANLLRSFQRIWWTLKGRYEWDRIQEIMELHERQGFKSCFFWLAEKGKSRDGILNADHDIQEPYFQNLMHEVEKRGFWNGLHKSSFEGAFRSEWNKLRSALPIVRNHYLKIQLPDHYQQLEEEGFLLDSSLGFSDAIGFRNSYGRPFHPFDPRTREKMSLLEVPLQIMDTALLNRREDPLPRMEKFIEAHHKNSVITILWHNNFFSTGKFALWRRAYLSFLELLKERGIGAFNPKAAIYTEDPERDIQHP